VNYEGVRELRGENELTSFTVIRDL